ncbi:MAG TPA: metallophosphoesterase [Symbiobacteriaceae bacterium]|nr:metallophosphoesterase [Symbiobacteriaceae bacterium]
MIDRSKPRRVTRRRFLKTALAVVAGSAGYAHFIEPRLVQFERVSVAVPSLPANLEGYTIGVLADLHAGELTSPAFIAGVCNRLLALKPDLVVVAGDMTAASRPPEAHRLVDESLAPVRGAYGVLGNYDIFHMRQPPMGVKVQSTVRLLVNQGVLVAPGLWLGGLDEGIFGEPDVGKALAGAPKDAVRILLAHEPDLADLVRPEHRVSLMISGHTHGGQVRLPILGAVALPPLGRKYVAGLNRAPACQVYTSRGVGVTGLPFRFLCPPEVTLLTLRRAKAGN